MIDALRRLAHVPDRDGPLGSMADATTSWPHLKLHPLTFDRLSIGNESLESDGRSGSQAIDLWTGLARAALALDTIDDSGAPVSPAAIARAINAHGGEGDYDRAIIRYLLEIAHELTTATADNAAELHEQTMQLIAAIDPAALRRLVRMGGDAEQRHQF